MDRWTDDTMGKKPYPKLDLREKAAVVMQCGRTAEETGRKITSLRLASVTQVF